MGRVCVQEALKLQIRCVVVGSQGLDHIISSRRPVFLCSMVFCTCKHLQG